MNQERIRELAEQAKAFIVEPEQAKIGEVSEVSFDKYSDLEKFAELIIAKCIEEAGEPADGLIKGDTWHDGVRASIWSIKQYFGVEE